MTQIEASKVRPDGHGQPCYYCGEPVDALVGNPNRWPLPFCHTDDPGRVKWHHTGCVTDRLMENQPHSATEAALRVVFERIRQLDDAQMLALLDHLGIDPHEFIGAGLSVQLLRIETDRVRAVLDEPIPLGLTPANQNPG